MVRSFTLQELIRDQERQHLSQRVHLTAALIRDHTAEGLRVDEDFLREAIGPDTRLEYVAGRADPIVVRGADWSDEAGEDPSATASLNGATLTLSQSPETVQRFLGRDVGSIVTLFLLVDVVSRGSGPVRLVFDGNQGDHLHVRIVCERSRDSASSTGDATPIGHARAVVEAMGGRLQGDGPTGDMEVWLPRR